MSSFTMVLLEEGVEVELPRIYQELSPYWTGRCLISIARDTDIQ